MAFNLKQTAECLIQCIEADIPAMMWGPPGAGKSDVTYQIGARLKRKVIDFRLSIREPVDLRGLPYVDPTTKRTIWLAPQELPDEKRDGKYGILFMDEIVNASVSMQAAAFGLVLERRIGEYTLPPGWIPLAAGNRIADRAAAQRMPTALRNRFAHFEVVPDLETWCEWANTNKIHPMMIAFLRFRPGLLHIMPKGDENSFPTPRSWAQASKFCDSPEEIRQHLIGSLVGEGPAAEFEGFARIWARLPNLDTILKNPKAASVPDRSEPAVFFAISSALARRANKTNFANILEYAQRMPKEFDVTTATDAVRMDPTLTKTVAFAQWAVRNQEVVL